MIFEQDFFNEPHTIRRGRKGRERKEREEKVHN
jgi:hypothetical protein